MIKFKNKGTHLKYVRKEYYDVTQDKYIFTQGEELIGAYEAKQNYLLFTNKKVVFVEVKGLKKDYTIIPYTKMQFCSVAKYMDNAIIDINISYIQRIVVTLIYGIIDADAISQAYTFQNSVNCVLEKETKDLAYNENATFEETNIPANPVKKSKKNKKNNAPEFIQEPVQEPVYNNEYVNPNPYAGEEVQNQNVVDQNIVDQNNTFNE